MTKPLRALLLAAGFGTRLRPITSKTPKCLVSVGGEPLLYRWLTQLESVGCESVLINTHYLCDQVYEFVKKQHFKSMTIETTYEPKLLGTAGTLLSNHTFFEGASGFLIHADNAMAGDLSSLLSAHAQRQPHCLLTMLTFDSNNPKSCGIVETDSLGVVNGFYEKIDNPPSNRANGALYCFDNQFIKFLVQMRPTPVDFSLDVIPQLMGRIQSCHTNQPYLDIGTPESLAAAQLLFSSL